MTDPSSDPSRPSDSTAAAPARGPDAKVGLLDAMENWLRRRGRRNGDDHMRDAIEDLIESVDETEAPIGPDERQLLSNVLQLRDSTVEDVMVPRVDIVGVEVDSTMAEVVEAFNKAGHSRLVVYRGGLDDALGMVHIKDILAWRGRDEEFRLIDIVRRTLFVAPSMGVLELLLEMRVGRVHMALVVDEYGGIDGLVTIEGLVEEIVGEFESERTRNSDPRLDVLDDGSLMVDGRVEIEAFEHHVGPVLTDAEREDIDTVGGLVAAVAGRVPIRGELIRHPSGLEFQILEADPRTVKRLKVLRIQSPSVARRPLAPSGTAGSGAAPGAENAPPDAASGR
jgi:magnesium and cobalt transporter